MSGEIFQHWFTANRCSKFRVYRRERRRPWQLRNLCGGMACLVSTQILVFCFVYQLLELQSRKILVVGRKNANCLRSFKDETRSAKQCVAAMRQNSGWPQVDGRSKSPFPIVYFSAKIRKFWLYELIRFSLRFGGLDDCRSLPRSMESNPMRG